MLMTICVHNLLKLSFAIFKWDLFRRSRFDAVGEDMRKSSQKNAPVFKLPTKEEKDALMVC